ncbi:hypothetical protein ACH5RR_026390 [Cinchona calisaya]|uniref:Uncharacterized protein n=1 Tax=Cinchona calisaya TaxID=153742 RepID=A0ABD2Z2E7_9GENT
MARFVRRKEVLGAEKEREGWWGLGEEEGGMVGLGREGRGCGDSDQSTSLIARATQTKLDCLSPTRGNLDGLLNTTKGLVEEQFRKQDGKIQETGKQQLQLQEKIRQLEEQLDGNNKKLEAKLESIITDMDASFNAVLRMVCKDKSDEGASSERNTPLLPTPLIKVKHLNFILAEDEEDNMEFVDAIGEQDKFTGNLDGGKWIQDNLGRSGGATYHQVSKKEISQEAILNQET